MPQKPKRTIKEIVQEARSQHKLPGLVEELRKNVKASNISKEEIREMFKEIPKDRLEEYRTTAKEIGIEPTPGNIVALHVLPRLISGEKKVAESALGDRTLTVEKMYKHDIEKHISTEQDSRTYDFTIAETTVYHAGDKTLVFVGADHIYGEMTPFIQSLRNILDAMKPDHVLLERPTDWSKEDLERGLKSPKQKWSEIEWLISFAKEHGIEFNGMDLADNSQFKPFMEMKGPDGIRAGILTEVLFTYYYYSYRLKENRSKEDIYDSAVDYIIRNFTLPSGKFASYKKEFLDLREKYKELSLQDFVKQVVQEATDKYIEKKPFLSFVKEHPGEGWMAPYPFGTKYEFNKIRAWVHAYRNKIMIDCTMKAMKEHKVVMAVAGWGHIHSIRDLLADEIKKEFGPVEVVRWKEFVKSTE